MLSRKTTPLTSFYTHRISIHFKVYLYAHSEGMQWVCRCTLEKTVHICTEQYDEGLLGTCWIAWSDIHTPAWMNKKEKSMKMNNSNEEIKSKLDHAVLISLQLCIKMFQEHNKLNPEAEYNKFTTLDLLCILLCTLDVGLPFVFLFWDLLLKCCILSHVLSSSSSPPPHTHSLFSQGENYGLTLKYCYQ